MLQPEPLTASAAEVAESPNLRWVSLIPVICLIAVIVTAIKTYPSQGDVNIVWGGISLVSPIASADHYPTDKDEMRFDTNKPATVRAAMTGSVVLTPERALQIDNGTVSVSYKGLTSISVKNGQPVTKGEAIGRLEPDFSSHGVLLLKVYRQGECLKPTAMLKP